MDIRKRTNKIRSILRTTYPDVKTMLHHETPFQLLVATILSAQCTDRQVNAVTGQLFARWPDAASLALAAPAEIEAVIHSTGFYRNKARHIRDCARELVARFDGEVPRRIDDLVALPGVGRKTANVVRGSAFGIPAMVVDTHVGRISRRLGLTGNSDPVKVEQDLMAIMPRSAWNSFSLLLISLGREFCRARKPDCGRCPLRGCCHFAESMA